MAENVPQSVEVPVGLSVFGSLVTEMSASDLPEGVSPDNQDIVFYPGGVRSRPGLTANYSGQLPSGCTTTFIKTYIQEDGVPLNLILDSLGNLYYEDVFNNPGILTKIATVTPGCYCSSTTAFGREYFAFHNGVDGVYPPMQFDGTYFDRVSQYGPGASATVQNMTYPVTNLTTGSTIGPVTITSATTLNNYLIHSPGPPIYAHNDLQVTTSTPHGMSVGMSVLISGNSNSAFNRVGTITVIDSPTVFEIGGFQATSAFSTPLSGTGGTVSGSTSAGLVRTNNEVTGTTSSPHSLQVGYQVQIQGTNTLSVGGGISTIVVNNENTPGVATVTTNSAHGLSPGSFVSINGVSNASVGGPITSAIRAAQNVTITTTNPHGLKPGASITIAGVTDTSFNGTYFVAQVPTPNSFTYISVDNDATSSGGTVTSNWPITTTPNPTYYEVLSCPTPTSFQIQFYYSDATWTGGTVTLDWDGFYFVDSTPSTTTFTYQNYGPNASLVGGGTVTPFGQAAPGLHQMVVLFETRQGFVTAPSPPITINANGGQYLLVTNIPIGPPNVVSRILAFTGAGGSNFFYIPVPGQVNGITVSTSTVVNDNTTTAVVLDFSDLTLFNGIAIDIPGNNLFRQTKLGQSIGTFYFASRLSWWGEHNTITNFLNLDFEGGYNNSSTASPCGWNSTNNHAGVLSSTGVGGAYPGSVSWQIVLGGSGTKGQLSQSAYVDYNGIAIITPNVDLTVRFWAKTSVALPPTTTLVMQFYSPSAGLIMSGVLTGDQITTAGSFLTMDMEYSGPDPLPVDTIFEFFITDNGPSGANVAIDEIEFWSTTFDPYTKQISWSYIENPEAFDGETGQLGPTDDTNPIQCAFEHRSIFYFLTSSGLHATQDMAQAEPEGWDVEENTLACGAVSPRACDIGENFAIWVSNPAVEPVTGVGVYVFTGGNVYKVSQEIQPNFDGINQRAQQTVWTKNDPHTRRVYFGVPVGTATAPNQILVLDYRELDTAEQMVERPPVHISFTGKMICSDLSRKWTRWNISANHADILRMPDHSTVMCVAGGNGQTPGAASGFANVYAVDASGLVDADYGPIVPYYTTYFFVNHEMEQALQLGLHRKLFKRYAAYVQGVGNLQIIPYSDVLSNPYPSPPLWPLSLNQTYDIGDGINVSGERAAFRIGSIPIPPANTSLFDISKFIVTICQEPVAPLRFGTI